MATTATNRPLNELPPAATGEDTSETNGVASCELPPGADSATVDGYLSAAYVGTVTLDQIVAIRYQIQNDANSDTRRSLIGELRNLSRYYQSQSSLCVIDNHFCQRIPAAVALLIPREAARHRSGSGPASGRIEDRIDISYLSEASCTTNARLESAIWHCKRIYLQALDCRARRRTNLVRSIFAVFVHILSVADAQAMNNYDEARTTQDLDAVNQQLLHLQEMLEKSNTMEARQDYLLGMLFGAVGLVGLFGLTFYIVGLLKSPPDSVLLGVAAAGSIGAIVSVMTRLTSGKLAVDDRAGRVLIGLSGGFRPIIGSIFGLVLYIFVAAKLLPIDVTVTGVQLTYFNLAIAFIAGFSERLAQDAITRASSAIPAANSSEKTPIAPTSEGTGGR